MVPVYWQWEKQLPFSGFSCRARRWTMRSSGFGCCTTKTLSPSRGGCSQEGSTWPWLMTVTPQPSTRPWLESHTVSKGASCPAHHKKKNPARVHRQNHCSLNLPAPPRWVQWEKFLLWAHLFSAFCARMSNVVYKDTGLLFLRDNNAEATTLL